MWAKDLKVDCVRQAMSMERLQVNKATDEARRSVGLQRKGGGLLQMDNAHAKAQVE